MTGNVIIGGFIVGGTGNGLDAGSLPINIGLLHILHSMNIYDPVHGGAADGQRWTSLQRDSHINQAIRRWEMENLIAGMVKEQIGLDSDGNGLALSPYIKEESQVLVNNVLPLTTWTGGMVAILGAFNASKNQPVKRLPEKPNEFKVTNTYLMPSPINQYWAIDAGQFRLYDGSTTTGDTINLRYLKKHTDLVASTLGGSDILVMSQYWAQILDLAKSIAETEQDKDFSYKDAIVLQEIQNA